MPVRRYVPLAAQAMFWGCWLAVLGGFIGLSAWAHGSDVLPFDKRPTVWVQDLHRYGWADPVFGFVNDMGGYESVAAIAIALFGVLLFQRRAVEAAIIAGAGAMRFAQLGVRHSIDRPFSWDATPDPVEVFPTGDSFPSGHVFGEVLIFGLIFAFAPRVFRWWPAAWAVRAFCLFIIVLGGPARLYTGAHWPSDVIGAALLALVYLMPALWLDWWVGRRRRMAEERELAIAAGVITRFRPRPLRTTPAADAPAAAPEREQAPTR